MPLALLLGVYLDRLLGMWKEHRLEIAMQANIQRKTNDEMMQEEDLPEVSAKAARCEEANVLSPM